MPGFRFAIQTWASTYAGYAAAAQWAESAALDAFAIPDHYVRSRDLEDVGPALDALAVMAGLARDTSSIELVVLVSPITFRHPAVLAKNFATIAEMSAGRFVLGVGTGWLEAEHTAFGFDFHDVAGRFARLEEALAYLRAAFADPPVPFSGDYFKLEPFDIQPRPDLRLVVGGTGAKRTPRLAGTFADELNAYPAPPEQFAEKVQRARSAAAAAGRDPDRLLISSSGLLVGGDTESEVDDAFARVAEELGRDADEIKAGFRERGAPFGTWDHIRERLDGLAAVGMQRFYIQQLGDFDPDAVQHALDRLGHTPKE